MSIGGKAMSSMLSIFGIVFEDIWAESIRKAGIEDDLEIAKIIVRGNIEELTKIAETM